MVITSGISQTGGKFRLRKRLLEQTPYHEFFLSMFLGAGHMELNKPRCRYECWNDAESDIINYLVQIQEHPKEFDAMKQGVFGLVSQEICNRIVRGDIVPKNDLEKAYFFYYLNKLTFGGSIWKVRKKPPYALEPKGLGPYITKEEVEEIKTGGLRGNTKDKAHYRGLKGVYPLNAAITEKNVKKAKQEYEIKTKGYTGLNQNRAIPQSTFHKEDIEKIKGDFEEMNAKYRGVILPTVCKDKSVNDAKVSYSLFSAGMGSRDGMGHGNSIKKAKANFREGVPKAPYKGIHGGTAITERDDIPKMKERFKQKQAPYGGLIDCGNVGGTAFGKMPRQRDLHIYQESYNKTKASYKGTNPKTTRPFQNNDCGLLSPINPEAIKRLRYVNLTAYDFRKVYKMFYEAFHVRKGLGRECFIYADPPYPGTEKYYGDLFKKEDHQDLIEIIVATPFNFMLSIGGDCGHYIDILTENSWNIVPVKVKYSTDANSQKDSQEYICMNYDIKKVPKMIMDNQPTLMNYIEA